jgi:hypothetical protein
MHGVLELNISVVRALQPCNKGPLGPDVATAATLIALLLAKTRDPVVGPSPTGESMETTH